MELNPKYMYGSITINIEAVERQNALLTLSRFLVYKALQQTTTGSPYRQWKWACRAVPSFFARWMRREMNTLVDSMKRHMGTLNG